MSDPVSTVVIGYGHAGRSFHAYLVGLTPGLELAGVVTGDPERQAAARREHDCRVWDSAQEVFADPAVELVVLATPNDVHADLAVAALGAGKHVVTDKPMTLWVAEVDRMVQAARRADRMLSVFQNRRWDGDYLTVKRLLEAGRLGRLRRIEMAWGSFGMPGGWRGTAEAGGGRLWDLGAHLADQLVQLAPGPATQVWAQLQYDSPDHDVESDAKVMVGFGDGMTGVLTTSSIAGIDPPRFYVAGSAATFRKHGLDPQEAAMKAGDIDAAEEPADRFGQLSDGRTTETIPTRPGRWRSYYENVAAHLAGQAGLAVTPESVRPGIAIIEAAFRSHETGEAVRVG